MTMDASSLAPQSTRQTIAYLPRAVLAPLLLFLHQLNETSKRTPRLRALLIKLSIYYLLFSPIVAMPFYNTVIFHPFVTGHYEFNEISSLRKQDVFFLSQGKRLHGWYFFNPTAQNVVLISHGNAGNITHRKSLIKMILDSQNSVFIYDYQGYGLSHGSPSVEGCCADAIAAYDQLSKMKSVSQEIVLYGESLGTGVTCQLAQHRKASRIILQSAFQSLPQIAREKIPVAALYPPFFFPANKLDSKAFLQGSQTPVLLIHGTKDDIIPSRNSIELYKTCKGTKQLIELSAAGHNDVVEKMTAEAKSKLIGFLKSESHGI